MLKLGPSLLRGERQQTMSSLCGLLHGLHGHESSVRVHIAPAILLIPCGINASVLRSYSCRTDAADLTAVRFRAASPYSTSLHTGERNSPPTH